MLGLFPYYDWSMLKKDNWVLHSTREARRLLFEKQNRDIEFQSLFVMGHDNCKSMREGQP